MNSLPKTVTRHRNGDYCCCDCVVVAELNVQIERRHAEIAEMLRMLLQLDAANRAEADALARLPSADDPTLADARPSDPGSRPAAAAAAAN